MYINHFEKRDITYLNNMLLKDDKFQILSYDKLKDVPRNDICQFCLENGMYVLPTTELIDFLKKEMCGNTIEICSGNGILAEALNIKATDSYMQELPHIKSLYEAAKQPIVRYGSNVQRIDAESAVKLYKPKTVIGSWVTHKYDPKRHSIGGNILGPDENVIMKSINKYIFIGNLDTHKDKPLLSKYTPVEYRFDWYLSRALKREDNMIWIFEK